MGKKKRTQVFVLKPWCWYCEREFEDEKVLLQHQKSKHFKCQLCPRKLNTAGGLMVHSQQVHKCEPEPLTNTLPGRDGYDIEIFGMEGVPTNALAEWKARKETEAGTAAMAAAASGKRPRQSYTVIPEADLMAALAQHKALMSARNNPAPVMTFPPFLPGAPPPFPGMPPPSLPPGFPPGYGIPPPTLPPGIGFQPYVATSGSADIRPSFPPPFPPPINFAPPPPTLAARPPPAFVTETTAPTIQGPKDGVMWPDITASPAEKRALQPRYRYTTPTPDESRKRKADI